MSALSAVVVEPDIRWNPARGPVAMYCLIGAESAIFAIFVVAYIFFIGKSLTGPQPRDVLQIPVFATICLLASSLTIHAAVKLLRTGRVCPSAPDYYCLLRSLSPERRASHSEYCSGTWCLGRWLRLERRLPC